MSEEETTNNKKAFENTVQTLIDKGLDVNRGVQVITANTISEVKYQLDSYQSFAGPWLCILQMQSQSKEKNKK